MSVEGRYKVTILAGESAEMVVRADEITVLPDGALYVVGDRQKRKFSADLWRSISIENDRSGLTLGKAD
jgi:hypothetical protein